MLLLQGFTAVLRAGYNRQHLRRLTPDSKAPLFHSYGKNKIFQRKDGETGTGIFWGFYRDRAKKGLAVRRPAPMGGGLGGWMENGLAPRPPVGPPPATALLLYHAPDAMPSRGRKNFLSGRKPSPLSSAGGPTKNFCFPKIFFLLAQAGRPRET